METVNQCAERIVNQEVGSCMSYLVTTLANAQDSSDLHGEILELSKQALELVSPIDDYEEALIQEGFFKNENDEWNHAYIEGIWKDPIEACKQLRIEPYQQEPLEFWAVSDWLANKLIEQDEKVEKDFGGMTIWARTTSGQMISADSCIQQIAENLLSNK